MTKILRKLRGRDLDGFYGRLRRRGLSSTSFRRYHAVLSASLNQAVRWGLVEHSPAAQATPPGLEHNEPAAPSAENIKLLIEEAQERDSEFATLLFVAATTGCRRGELCALQWSDVDLEDGSLVVRKSVSDLPGRVEVRTTKTGLVRRMALDPATVAVLEAQRNLAAARCAAIGVALEPDAFVWSQAPDYKQPLRPSRVTAQFTELRSRLGLGAIRFHHLRHFAATVMLAGGIDVRTGGRPPRTLSADTHPSDVRPRHDVTDRKAADILARSITPAEQ